MICCFSCRWVDYLCLACTSASTAQSAPREEKQMRRIFAKVVDVYDGDTFTICYRRDNTLVRRRCRSYGYDSPELRTSNAYEKEAAMRARDFLANWLPTSRPIRLQIHGTDKYGRLLVSYTHNGISLAQCMIEIAQCMIENGHGVAYDGGSKPKWHPANSNLNQD